MARLFFALCLCFAHLVAFAQGSTVNPSKAPDIRMVPKIICVGEWAIDRDAKKVPGSFQPARFALSHGSGIVISQDGLILTNRHVVNDCSVVLIQFPGSRRLLPGFVAYMDQDEDVAFVVADSQGLVSYDLATVAEAQSGQALIVEGYPIDIKQNDPAITTGVVSRWYERPNGRRWLQMSAAISGGNSGGPVFDESGRLLGISVASLTRGQNFNFAVPSSAVVQAYRDMQIGNDVARARSRLTAAIGARRFEYAQAVYAYETGGGEAAWNRIEQLIKQGSSDALAYGAGQYYEFGTKAFDKGDKDKGADYILQAISYAGRAVAANSELVNNDFLARLLDYKRQLDKEKQPAAEAPSTPVASAASAPGPVTAPVPAPVQVPAQVPVQAPVQVPAQVPGSASAGSLLRLHGSNTIGAELAPALATEFLVTKGATDVRTVAGARQNEVSVIGTLNGRQVAIEIFAHGTATAFADLGNGSADVGMASRAIKDDEFRKLSGAGDLRSFDNEHVIGLDGIAIIVNSTNRIPEISTRDVARIFSGEVTDWSQLGSGMRGLIRLHARDKNSGTMDTFKAIVLGDRALSNKATVYESNEALSDAVAADEGSIGFVSLPAIRRARAVPVATGPTAMIPTVFSIRTEDYPLKRRLYFYTPSALRNPSVRDFLDFTHSDAGQRVVEKIGFVGQLAEPIPEINRADATPRYRSLTNGKQRLSINFRFRSGSFDLENKALRDLDTLVKKLSEPENRKAELHFFGFADNVGNREGNCRLSERRAQAVADSMRRYGLRPSIAGFCDEMPVAPNDTEDGREINRRVEVWIKRR